MHVVIAADSAWSYGGAVLTFVFPMLLFIFVAGGLYVAYTRPHLVPGHRYEIVRSPGSTATAPVRAPGQAGEHGGQAGTAAGPVAATGEQPSPAGSSDVEG